VKDALIDVAVSLGAPLSKLILTAPAFANAFNLVDPDRNLPGSAVTGLPTTLTYQQVCYMLHGIRQLLGSSQCKE
jgi:hypothetical protein